MKDKKDEAGSKEVREPLVVWSMGHSNVTIDEFIDLVRFHEIDVIADVRSIPFSQYTPQFNKELLERSLKHAGVRYQFMGKSLGGRPPENDLYDAEGHVLYSELSANFRFKVGVEELCVEAEKSRVAMMCSEESPEKCHRRLLISRVLTNQGVKTFHIREDKSIQLEQDLIVEFGSYMFTNLLGDEPWRSIQSVLRNGQRSDSSGS